jgi:hypothetical protein
MRQNIEKEQWRYQLRDKMIFGIKLHPQHMTLYTNSEFNDSPKITLFLF